MNKLDVNQIGGFPLTTRILDELQKIPAVFNGLGAISGDMTIISGCDLIGSTVSNGVVYVNNEVFEFRGGIVQTKVIIKEDKENLVFENKESKTVIRTRYVTFGTGVGALNWSEFSRPPSTKSLFDILGRLDELEKKNAVFQADGGMVLWNKPAKEIPEGWQEVENWRGRMPVGYDASQPEFDEIGKEDGHKEKMLLIEELPKISPINGTLIKRGGAFGGSTGLTIGDIGTGNFEEGELIKPFGGDQPFSILNPYRVVMFIEYVG